jgi:hypothetical protein
VKVPQFRRARILAALSLVVGVGVGLVISPSATAAVTPRVQLDVLVVTDGTPWVEGIRQQLSSEGVPTTVLDLTSASRPVITAGYLADQLPDGTPRAKFQGVVLPSNAPSQLSAAELTALASYESTYSVREVDSYVYPGAAVGENPQWAGSLDGTTAALTSAARGDAFRYLNGPVPFEAAAPNVTKSYGYLATPAPDNPATGSHFEPYLTETIPGTTTTGTLAGVYTSSGRQQFVISFTNNYNLGQFRLLAHGIVDWVTRGVHFGNWRNYFSVHIDDLFSADSRWSQVGKCTPGEGDCAPGVPATQPIRMTATDVTNVVTWQQQHNYELDFLFNGAGSDQANQPDPLTVALLANKNQFWWMNHTYTHAFLGCVQDFTVIPWRCQTDAAGNVVYVDLKTINGEIQNNLAFAARNGIPIRPDELTGGEHSGTFILPQQPNDNPNFLTALSQNSIGWLGLDASREPAQRQVSSALGVPRHPINVFYNVSTAPDEVSEYNWIYNSKADGGSGICEEYPQTTTCIPPLDLNTGWQSYILPLQVQITMGYVTGNDPRPYYMHQSNLSGDRLALQAVGAILTAYRNAFAANTPAVDQTMTDSGLALQRQTAWQQTLSAGTVSGYVQGGVVTVQGPAGASAPLTVPAGATVNGSGFGDPYGGEQSGYLTVGASPYQVTLAGAPYGGPVSASTPLTVGPAVLAATSAPATAPASTDRSGSYGPLRWTVHGGQVTISDPQHTATLPELARTTPRPTGAPVQPAGGGHHQRAGR